MIFLCRTENTKPVAVCTPRELILHSSKILSTFNEEEVATDAHLQSFIKQQVQSSHYNPCSHRIDSSWCFMVYVHESRICYCAHDNCFIVESST